MPVFPLALVTGAAHRLGKAFALSLARQGFAVLLHYHTAQEQAEQTAREIRYLGMPVYPFQADLSQPEQIETLFTFLDMLPHPFKVMVNSAAILQRGNIQTLPHADWDLTLDINLRAPFLCAQQAALRMEAGSLIVNVSDVGAQKTWSAFPAYTVSKSALETLTRILARSLAPQIRVNALAPGLVLHSDVVTSDEWKRLVERLPLRRPAALEEITSALEFLIKNEYITGQTLVVDGGYSLL
ncbi:MAG: SDR family NAD(P)-dependent oxidoreductase [Anaerolineae bacterium]